MDGNAFLTSLQQLGQYLNQQNQGTGSGGIDLSSGYPQGAPGGMNLGGNPSNIAKVVTQVHYNTDTGGANQAGAQPAVASPPPAPQVSNYAVPQTAGNTAIPQPGGAAPSAGGGQGAAPARPATGGGVDYRNTPYDPDPDTAYGVAAGPASGAGSGQPTSSAISGITSALSKGMENAASAIGNVKTMPTPINMPGVPGINQVAPTLIGRRTQQNPYGY